MGAAKGTGDRKAASNTVGSSADRRLRVQLGQTDLPGPSLTLPARTDSPSLTLPARTDSEKLSLTRLAWIDIVPAMSEPVAYFITFTTYGTWLHGRAPGSVDREHNQPGTAFLPADVAEEAAQFGRL